MLSTVPLRCWDCCCVQGASVAPCAKLLMREQSWCPGAAQRPPAVRLLIITCSLPDGLVSLAAHAAAHLQRVSVMPAPCCLADDGCCPQAGTSSSLGLGCCSWADKGIPGIFPGHGGPWFQQAVSPNHPSAPKLE